MKKPWQNDLELSREVARALTKLAGGQPELSISNLGSERKWIIQLYAADLFKRFGGLNIVDKGLLPLGVNVAEQEGYLADGLVGKRPCE